MKSLGEILSGSEGTETETETETETVTTEQETEQPEQETAQVETETGVAETQVAAEKEVTPEPDEVKGLKAAAAAERSKRQAIEAEREALRQEIEALRRQPAKPEDEKPFLGEEYEQRFTETEQKLKEEVIQSKIMLSRDYAMDKHADYEEKEAEFIKMVQTNPALIDQMRASANPAAFAYKTVTDFQHVQKLREIGDPAKYEAELTARIREQERANILAELEAEKKAATEAAIRAKLPRSGFAEERSVGTARATVKTYTGPTPLNKLVGRR